MRRRGPVAGAVLALVVGAAAPARADVTTVGIGNLAFTPPRVTVVAGDDVLWRNGDFTSHTATAADGTFDSGAIGRGQTFLEHFPAPGTHPFYCTIHPGMHGEVDVVAATLHAPATVLAGERVTLAGRAAAGTPGVTLQQLAGAGAWTDVAALTPDADGTFRADVTPTAASTYRVLTPTGPSPGVAVTVTERVDIALTVRRTRHTTRVAVAATPAPGRLVAGLQRYVPDRFAFRRVAHRRLSAQGRATFVLRGHPRGRVRVLLSRAVGGPAAAVSGAVILRDDARSLSGMARAAARRG